MWHLSKVPKILHVFWSNNILSFLRFQTINTFSKYNPDWQIRYYYPKVKYTGERLWNRDFPGQLIGRDYTTMVSALPNTQMIEVDFDSWGIGNIPEVYRSDLLRLKMLEAEGGIYVDMDILFFKPMADCWFNRLEYSETNTIISYHPTRYHYSIGFLGSSKGNLFYKHLYDAGRKKIVNKGDYQFLGIILWHGCFQTPSDILRTYPQLKILDIEMDLVYSLDSRQIKEIYELNVPLTNLKTVGLHWYAGHPLGVPAENNIREDTYKNINNTIAAVLRRALDE